MFQVITFVSKMTFDICLYTREKPEICQFLAARFSIEQKGMGNTLGDFGKSDPAQKRVYVVWSDDERDFVNLRIDNEPRPDFYPRYVWEPRLDFRHPRGLPSQLILDSYKTNLFLVADEKFWDKIQGTSLLENLPETYRRFLGVLNWTGGQPIYHTEFSTSSARGVVNAAGLARILAEVYDGIIWDPVNQIFGNPDVDDIVRNTREMNLMRLFTDEIPKPKPHLRLVTE